MKANGATVWFSEEDIPLGSLMTREIDKGLRNSRIGIVLVTPALLNSLRNEGIAEKELAVLLNSRRVVPVTHGVTFDELYDVSPMLASHAGLSTAETSLDDVVAKIAAAAAALVRKRIYGKRLDGQEMTAIIRDIGAGVPDGWFAAPAFRDRVQNGRKVAIQILDFFDRLGMTLRRGDLRRINPHRIDLFDPDAG